MSAAAPIAYGIDFGTSNSAIAAFLDDDTVEVVDVESGVGILPSLVYLNRDGNRLAGTAAADAFLISGTTRTRCRGCELVAWSGSEPSSACEHVRFGGFCMDARLVHQVKSSLADKGFDTTHSWGVDFSAADLVRTVLVRLKGAADQHFGADVRKAAIGHPVRFVGAEGANFRSAQQLALGRLQEAAYDAGFDQGVELVPESKAAITLDGVGDGFLVCTDFGGGTFDCSVVDVDGEQSDVLALDGASVGGEEYDGLLFDEFVSPAIGLNDFFLTADGQPMQLPARLRRRLRSLSGLRSLLTDPSLAAMLSGLRDGADQQTLRTVQELLYGGQAVAFYRAIERAKIELSDQSSAVIDFRRPWINLQQRVARSDFEDLIRPSLVRVKECLLNACQAAGVDPTQVGFLTRTGGSSRIPAFEALLHDVFPDAQLIDCDPFTAVVHGLAEYAGGEWADD